MKKIFTLLAVLFLAAGANAGTIIFEAGMVNDKAGFAAQDIHKGEGLTYVWTNNQYGWVASAFKNKCMEAESWLVSPAIDLTSAQEPKFSFYQTVNKLGGGYTIESHVTVLVSIDYTDDVTKATWDEVSISTWPTGKDWNFVNTDDIDLTKYAGKTIRIAFKYVSDTKSAPTWEIKNLTVSDGEDIALTTSKICDLVTAGKCIKAQVEGTVVAEYAKGFLVNDGTGNILVYLNKESPYAIGDQLTITGFLATYAGMLQFPAESAITKTGTTTVSTPSTEFSERDMDDMLGTNIVKYGQYTGTLAITTSSNGNVNYNITVPDCQTAIGSISYPKSGLVNKDWDGCEVTVKGYFIGTSSDKYFNTMVTEITSDGGDNPNKVDPVGTGVKEDPYNVSRFHDISVNDTTKAWVKGYVVGYLAGSLTKPRFDLTTDSVYASNILIADKADCTNTNYCIPVQVIKNSKFYNAVNLAANPGVLGKEIVIEGEFIKYFSAQGIKNVSTFILDGKEISEKGGDDEEKPDSLTVTELIAKDNDGKMHYVTGYIVGYVGGSSFEDVRFNAYTLKSDSTVTNILLADNLIDATCAVTDLIPVQLPSGEVRNALNLYDNDNMWQAKVRLLGKSTAYFGVKGLKEVSKFEVLEPGTSRVDTALVEEEKALYFDLTGKQIASPKNGLYIRVAGGRTSKVLIK
jgi:hypothetical protein